MSTSRAILFFAVVLIACAYLVSAAPIVNNEVAQLELAAVDAPRINQFRKHHDHDHSNDDNEDDEEEEPVTTTTTYTSTRTRKYRPTSTVTSTTTTAEPTTTTKSKSKTTTTTTTTAKASPTPKKNASSGSSSSYSGDATFYDTGLGSCGIVSSNSEYIVALNHGQMKNGANPNHNELCGKKITAHGPDGSVTVTIVDTCPGCAMGDLDLSPAAFSKIADMDRGRVPITWSFN